MMRLCLEVQGLSYSEVISFRVDVWYSTVLCSKTVTLEQMFAWVHVDLVFRKRKHKDVMQLS